MTLDLFSNSGAIFSPDRRYRYRLWRQWGDGNSRVAFLMLNPSTADATEDDPTIHKCVGFAKQWTQQAYGPSFGAIDVVNLFAWRSTNPKGLLDAADPVGPENELMIRSVLANVQRIVYAWGRHSPRVRAMVSGRLASLGWVGRTRPGCDIVTLGRCGDGSPRHPLMRAYASPIEPV
jgi:hypothetical protein